MYGEYTCLDCGKTFDEPKHWRERHGLDTPPYEQTDSCPYCGGDFASTVLCDACGQPITSEYVKIQQTGGRFCDGCFLMKSLGENDP